ALAAAGCPASYVDAVEVVKTDGTFGSASPDLALTERSARKALEPVLARRVVPVVPGFLGAAPDGQVATLGRGGSDLTATLLARVLGAREVSLWKDVPGLLTADPRIVPDARVVPQVHVREAAELAYYGAKVLHPRALVPVIKRSVAIRIRPFADPGSLGTELSRRRTLDQYPVKALSAIPHQALLTVTGSGMLGVPGIAARTFAAVHHEGISVSLISQASSEHSICFSVPEGSAERARRSLETTFQREIARREIDGVGVRADRAGARAPHREGETGFPEAPDRRADRPERLRVRRPRLCAPTAGRTGRGEGEGRLARQGGGRPPRDRRGGRRFRGAPRPLEPDPRGPHRRRHDRDPQDGARRRDAPRAGEQAPGDGGQAGVRRAPGGGPGARPPAAARSDRRRWAPDHRHVLQARRVGRPRAPDRGLPVRDAGLPVRRAGSREAFLRGAARRHHKGLPRAGPARGPLRERRGAQGAHPRPAARLRRRARERRRRVARAPRRGAAAAARLPRPARGVRRRMGQTRSGGAA